MGTVHFRAADNREDTCHYCGGTLTTGQPRQLIWLPVPDDPDDAVAAVAHIQCPT